jgi:hypothetical protein
LIEVSLLKIVGFTSLAVLVVAWLTVSFLAPGPTRARVSWVATTFMYLALLSLFTNLFQAALREGSALGMIAFGFLGLVFLAGFGVSVVRTLGELRSRG